MCDFCHAMTPRESEHFYEKVKAGKQTSIPAHVRGDGSPRKDLRERVLEELTLGDYDDLPAFKRDLVTLCHRADPQHRVQAITFRQWLGRVGLWLMNRGPVTDMHSFERKLVNLRHVHKRPVMTDAEVREAIAAAAERGREAARAAVAAAAGEAGTTTPRWELV